MSTDRELLEMAAKAAGIDGEYDSWCYQGFNEGIRERGTKAFRPWNPLRDDGDALRLAVKLALWKEVQEAHRLVDDKTDFYAATRRAVVCAAAEIWKDSCAC